MAFIHTKAKEENAQPEVHLLLPWHLHCQVPCNADWNATNPTQNHCAGKFLLPRSKPHYCQTQPAISSMLQEHKELIQHLQADFLQLLPKLLLFCTSPLFLQPALSFLWMASVMHLHLKCSNKTVTTTRCRQHFTCLRRSSFIGFPS